jgi:hypothetical protein
MHGLRRAEENTLPVGRTILSVLPPTDRIVRPTPGYIPFRRSPQRRKEGKSVKTLKIAVVALFAYNIQSMDLITK